MKGYGKVAAVVMLLSLMTGPLAACGAEPTAPVQPPAGEATQPPAAAEPVTLNFLAWWGNEWGMEVVDKLVADFEAGHPGIKINYIDFPWSDMAGKLQAAAAGGSESYDIYAIENEWIASMVKQGYIQDLDGYLSANPDFADSLTSITPMKFLGKTQALCYALFPYQFAYNVDILAEKGLEPPTNWDEFVEIEKKLRDPATNQYGFVASLGVAQHIATRYFGLRLAQEGGRWFDDAGNVTFNGPEGVAALQWWKDFYNMDLMLPGSLTSDGPFALEAVASGQAPTLMEGPQVWGKAKQIDPNIKLAYAPAWKLKTGGYSWACSGIAISGKSAHKDEAFEFFKYVYSPEVAVWLTKTISMPWATKAGMESLQGSEDPILRYIPDFSTQDPEHNLLYPVMPNMEQLLDALKLAFDEGMTGRKDIQTALDEAAAVWQKEIDAARTP